MKKTLITLMAFAGIAAADTQIISNAGNKASSTGGWFDKLSASSKVTKPAGDPFTGTDYTGSFHSVATNVGSGGTYDYVLTFTLANDVVLSSLNFDVFFYNKSGNAQGRNRTVKCSLVLSHADTPSSALYNVENVTATSDQPENNSYTASYSGSAYNEKGALILNTTTNATGDGSRYAALTVTPGAEVVLSAGITYQLTLGTAIGDEFGGTYVGIGNIAMTGVECLVSTVSGYAYEDGMLTLTVAGSLADVERAIITGFEDGVISGILGEVGVNGMVGLALTDGTDTLVADADKLVGFRGEYGTYYGEQVGDGENVSWQYNVSYIPEPATATLSLLALCGLAARRRRK